jgi:branched-chain amino acid aminotransferase
MNYNIKVTKTQDSRLSSVDFNNIPFGKIFSDHMFVVDYEDGEWKDPQIVPYGPLEMYPAAMVLHYGQAIFEGMKASKYHDGTPMLLRPELHARRLNLSADRLCMPNVPEDLFLQGLHTLIDLDKGWIPPQAGSALYIRPFMIATDEFIGVGESAKYKFMIMTGPVGPYYPKPIRLLAEQKYVRAVKGGTGEAKAAGNYAGSLLPAKEAKAKGFDQVMWMDGHEFKYIQEVGTMNIFFVIDGKVITPATDGAILKGITRKCIIEVLEDKGYEVEVRPLTIDEVVEAHDKGQLEEIFGAGTAVVVAHISELGYKDRVLTLPAIEGRKIGPMIKAEIDSLRVGDIEDTRGWFVPAKTPEFVDA